MEDDDDSQLSTYPPIYLRQLLEQADDGDALQSIDVLQQSRILGGGEGVDGIETMLDSDAQLERIELDLEQRVQHGDVGRDVLDHSNLVEIWRKGKSEG